jgi:GDP-4-dehydro-6-deoxy-D-mannose reductase
MDRPSRTDDSVLGGVLITGAMGFVGSHMAQALHDRVPWLAGLEHPARASCGGAAQDQGPSMSSAAFSLLQADITCRADVRAAMEALVRGPGPPQTVIHLAAQASAGRSFADPAAAYLTNVVGTANLLEALTDYAPGARVLIPSTAMVYAPEAAAQGPLRESAPLRPSDHYGASKWAQEQVARIFAAMSDLTLFVTRAFNHLGPAQSPDFVLSAYARQLAQLERAGKGALRVGNLDAIRDYLDVRDVVEAYLTVLAQGEPGEVYNVASGRAVSAHELLQTLLSQSTAAVAVEVDRQLLRPVDIPVLVGNNSRLRTLGWSPRFDLQQTVRDTLAWWRGRVSEEGYPPTSGINGGSA